MNFRLANIVCVLSCLTPVTALAEISVSPSGVGTYEIRENNLLVVMTIAPSGDDALKATIAIRDRDEIVLNTTGEEFFSPFQAPQLRLVNVDPANDELELITSQWTGGAHCCSDVTVYSKVGDTWKSISMGNFDGGLDNDAWQDLDYDGAVELKSRDNRFLYQFSSYAGSYAPPQIASVRNGEYTDLGRNPKMQGVVSDALDDMGEIPESGAPRNSWLAARTATLLLLGEDNALDNANSNYDRDVTWGMERCKVAMKQGTCPSGKNYLLTFPDALSEFLRQTGYLSEGQ